MHALAKYFEKGLSIAANAAWQVFSGFNNIRPNKSFTAQWSDKPLLKSYQKTRPTLGWPRRTDSLCPGCVRDARQNILDAIDQQLRFDPQQPTRNRKLLDPNPLAMWEVRIGRYRVFYDVDGVTQLVLVKALGMSLVVFSDAKK